ncbi:MAG: glycosyltransferase [bacterium]
MKNIPKVSIILPTYKGKYIQQSIDNCLNQTYKNIELIIVDDASFDEKLDEIINSYDNKKIKFIKHKENKKLPETLNTGFSNATGNYLTWTSDDNYYDSQAIEILVNFLETHSKIDFVYTNYYEIDENEKILNKKEVLSSENLIYHNCIGPCFLFRKKVYESIGFFNKDFFGAEDYDYWVRVYKNHFKMKKIDNFLYYYRLHKNSMTNQYSSIISLNTQKIIKKYFPLKSIKTKIHLTKMFLKKVFNCFFPLKNN